MVVQVNEQPGGPWIGRLPGGVTVELLAVSDNDRWWQPNGLPLATSPNNYEPDGRQLPPVPDSMRRVFVARLSGEPLQKSGLNFEIQSSSRTDWSSQPIQRAPELVYLSVIKAAMPTTNKTVTARWGVSTCRILVGCCEWNGR